MNNKDSTNVQQQMEDTDRTLFNWLQIICLQRLLPSYLKFKRHSFYKTLLKSLKKQYNMIVPDDFEYYEVLGEGGKYFIYNK